MRRNPGKATRPVATWVCLVKKKWEPYDDETSKILEEGYTSGKSKITLEHGFYKDNGPYVIDFNEMKQMNKQTGFVREVRRTVNHKTHITPTPEKKEKSTIMKDSSNDRRNSLMPRANSSIPQVPPEKLKPCYGDIVILLKGARDLAEIGPLGSNPFVVISTDFSPFVAKSEWKFKTTSPTWNHTFTIPVSRYDMDGNVLFTIYHFNHLKKTITLAALMSPCMISPQKVKCPDGCPSLTKLEKRKNNQLDTLNCASNLYPNPPLKHQD